MLDKLPKKSRTSDTTLIKSKILELCETVCDDRYPHKVRQSDFLKSKELLNILDEANCELTRKKKILRSPKPKRKKKGESEEQPSISVCTIQKVVREVKKQDTQTSVCLGHRRS